MTDATQLEAVKAYIAKHNLEDELSNAVNAAIKVDSDDPYRVISDYLRKFAKEADEDEDMDDDEDVIREDDEEAMRRPMGRRQQVAAKKVEVADDWVPPVFEKSEEAKAFLTETMKTNKLMKNLSPSDREQLMHAFQEESFAVGTAIITQGAEGDKFYILSDGSTDISITGKGSVMKATKGISFGELALLHDAPRAATVTAETEVKAFSIDSTTFKVILMGKGKKDTAMYIEFLKKVPILSNLKDEEIQELSGALTESEHAENKNIICEGDEGDKFYIIREGEVKCTKVGVADEVSKRLTEGDFFGELALLKDDKRAATVTAVKPTKVLAIKRAEFTRLLGTLEPPSYS